MRTAGTRTGIRSRGRGCAAEGETGLPEPSVLGRGRTSHGLSRESGALSRGPRLGLGTSGFTVERAAAYRGFILREQGFVYP